MKSAFILFTVFFFFSSVSISQVAPYFTWVNGADTTDQYGVYGTLGVSSSGNFPGARENSVSWSDDDNNLWLLGGHGYTTSGGQVYMNDLWKYSIIDGLWTWVDGSSSGGQNGVYGTPGVPSSSNVPGARQNAYSWTDENGNLWLFGGYGKAETGGLNYLNDLWRYDISANTWTWISGSNSTNDPGNYGTIGVSSTSNIPPARYGGNSWYFDQKLWLFGGQGFSGIQVRYNDLWYFDLITSEWVWVSGDSSPDQNGVYGTQGVAAVSNMPGARQASVAWIDNANNFWIFGGYGFPETGTHDYLNDMWKYNPGTNQWTWISGTNLTNQPAVYGTQLVGSVANIPGARQMSVSWKSSDGNLWLFGAWGHIGFSGGPTFGRINDLWKFNISTLEWTWMAGENWADEPGIYGSPGIASTSSIPGARRMSISFTDTSNVFWLFGGNGYDELDTLGLLNDLWKIDVEEHLTIQPVLNSELHVFPNPIHSDLIIQLNDADLHSLQIYDASGTLVSSFTASGNYILNMSDYENGLYFLKSEEHWIKLIKI